MRRSKEEIDEDLAALQRVMRAERRRRNELRNKAAIQGFSADPSVAIELQEIEGRLKDYDVEYAALETLAAEADLPIAEVQYRIAVAEAWNTPEGRPTVVGLARLELERLRLGVTPERAQVVERTVRAALAREAIDDLNVDALLGQFDQSGAIGGAGQMYLTIAPSEGGTVTIERIDMQQTFTQLSPHDNALRVIGRAVRLDPPTALQLLILLLPTTPSLEAATFGPRLLEVNQVAIYPDERPAFEGFIVDLRNVLASRSIADTGAGA